jgi:hypothetical protein
MITRARSMLLAAAVLAVFGTPVASQTPQQYEAFRQKEIAKCVAESVRLDKESGARGGPSQAERVASCREMVMQIHDLYPAAEPPKKKTR